jgi:hypothetical protein
MDHHSIPWSYEMVTMKIRRRSRTVGMERLLRFPYLPKSVGVVFSSSTVLLCLDFKSSLVKLPNTTSPRIRTVPVNTANMKQI